MRNDEELTFGIIIYQFIIADSDFSQAFRSFRVATRSARKLFDDDLSAAKCKDQAEGHEAVSAAVAASKLVVNQGSMIKLGSTPKDSKMNPTCNTDKPQ